MAGGILDINDNDFETEVLESPLPVLVDLWAPWCGPCRSLAPTLEQVAAEYAGRLKVVKLNVDDNPRTPHLYNVKGIPNLLFIKSGKLVDQLVGAVPKEQLVASVAKLL